MTSSTSGTATPNGLRQWVKTYIMSFESAGRRRFNIGIFFAAGVWGFVIAVASVFYLWNNLPAIGVILIVCLAAAAVGTLAGFLFGVPLAKESDGNALTQSQVIANSNLGQVSDWLTKIIIGVGLIQFQDIGSAILNMGQGVSAAIGSPVGGVVFAVSLIVGTTLASLVLAYMWTAVRFIDVFSEQQDESPPAGGDPP